VADWGGWTDRRRVAVPIVTKHTKIAWFIEESRAAVVTFHCFVKSRTPVTAERSFRDT